MRALRQALEQDPKNGPLWAHYAELLLQNEDSPSKSPSAAAPTHSGRPGVSPEAIEALRNAVDLGAGGVRIATELIRSLRVSGRLAEAVIRVEKMLSDATHPRLQLEHAWVLALRDENEDAARVYQSAVESDPSLADVEFEERLGLRASGTSPRIGRASRGTGPSEQPLQSQEQPFDPEPDRDESIHEESTPEGGSEMTDRREAVQASHQPDEDAAEESASHLAWGDIFTTFRDVAGLDDVKDQIRLRIIAPFQNEKIYQAFGRSAGGGLLLYGPPGCGKTFVARATAGEIGARFVSIGINEILDRWIGQSEKVIHALFDQARANAPTVLFFDEFDALGGSRGVGDNQFFRTVVDQLLQEMDGVGGVNEGVLVFAATNLPWHVDAAFRRPGRFDRVIFVPPPDEAARRKILATHIEPLPTATPIDVDRLAKRTTLFSGADLRALCERASERALSASLRTNEVVPVTQDDFERGLEEVRSTAEEWIATARNHAKYSNQGGRYDDVIRFLKSINRW
ncbi:MAG: AAA family ATPase [Candidatus Eisenbacteria bacterium]|uniref:AAA family ATPase n=1 Tax=Eiseniibacteriota bacterium TaxID=2212470 RepID=A0A956SG55_UNCEI|nr:AAA family ATPase [Candidatus Eisenbacteria bacterium]